MKNSPIYFNNIQNLVNQLSENKFSKLFILVDKNTHEHCFPKLITKLDTKLNLKVIEVPPGEEYKDINTTSTCWETLANLGADRDSLLINLGGGVITDLGGFIASTYKRGIKFINIPTSLLAMVDASVGGKNGIDFNGIKNQIGTFNQPIATYIFPDFLNTLPQNHLVNGFAEMLKHGLINSPKHWSNLTQLTQITPDNITSFIKDSISIKEEIVSQDPLEKGIRKSLNFGHTVGHAIESEYLTSEEPLLHGEAIAYGMVIESIIALNLNFIKKDLLDEVYHHITKYFKLKIIPEELFTKLINWMKNDKKNKNNQFSFSLISNIGEPEIEVFVNEQQVVESFKQFNIKINQ